MPEELDMLAATGVAALVATLVAAAMSAPWRPPRTVLAVAGLALGVGAGIVAGCWWGQLLPDWPPSGGRDRLLTLVLPAAVLVQFIGAPPRVRGWVRWLLRALVAGALLPVLLRNSIYLGEYASADSWSDGGKWSGVAKWIWLLGFPIALLLIWALMELLASRPAGSSVPVVLGLATGAAGVTLMLSASASTGQVGPPIAGALFGTALAALLISPPMGMQAAAGVGVIALAGLLVVGHFFAELRLLHFAVLLTAPLLAWLTELPRFRRDRAWLVAAIRVVVVLVPLGLVALQAKLAFDRHSAETSDTGSGSGDYLNTGY